MPTTDRHHDVLDALGRAVVGGEIAPGASLTLEDVQSRYGVSRTLARDCVRALESLGVVVSRRRVGIVVRPREKWSALAPQVVRWQLEVDPRGPKLGALTELRAAVEDLQLKYGLGDVANPDDSWMQGGFDPEQAVQADELK